MSEYELPHARVAFGTMISELQKAPRLDSGVPYEAAGAIAQHLLFYYCKCTPEGKALTPAQQNELYYELMEAILADVDYQYNLKRGEHNHENPALHGHQWWAYWFDGRGWRLSDGRVEDFVAKRSQPEVVNQWKATYGILHAPWAH